MSIYVRWIDAPDNLAMSSAPGVKVVKHTFVIRSN